MTARGYGRTVLETGVKGRKWTYHHEFEHRGYGIVAIYSYGPAGKHEALVREAQRVMRSRFGVAEAVSSGGCSGGGYYAQKDGTAKHPDWRKHTEETQTIFSIDAVSGPNRRKPKQVPPREADWHVGYIVDAGQDCLGDGEVNLYFTGPLENEEAWRTWVDRAVCEALEDDRKGSGRATVLELKVSALAQGRYWFLADDGPVVEMSRFEVRV